MYDYVRRERYRKNNRKQVESLRFLYDKHVLYVRLNNMHA